MDMKFRPRKGTAEREDEGMMPRDLKGSMAERSQQEQDWWRSVQYPEPPHDSER